MSDEFLIKLFLLYYVLIELLIHPKAMLWYCKRPCFRMQKHAFCNAVCRLLYCIYSVLLLASAVIAFGLAIIIRHLFTYGSRVLLSTEMQIITGLSRTSFTHPRFSILC